MAVYADKATFSLSDTQDSTQSITGLSLGGNSPKLLVFISNYESADADSTTARWMFGLSDGTRSRFEGASHYSGGSTYTRRFFSDNYCVGACGTTGTSFLAGAHVSSVYANGFDLYIDLATASVTPFFQVLAISADTDAEFKAYVDDYHWDTTAGNITIST